VRHDPRPPRTIAGASRLSQLAPAGVVVELSPRVQGAYLRQWSVDRVLPGSCAQHLRSEIREPVCIDQRQSIPSRDLGAVSRQISRKAGCIVALTAPQWRHAKRADQGRPE